MRMHSLIALILLGACGGGGGGSGGSVSPTGGSTSPSSIVTLPSALGWLAIAPVATSRDDVPYWLPVDASTALLPIGTIGFEAPESGTVVGVPARGAPVTLSIGERRAVSYGCDDNSFEAIPLQGEDGAEPPTPGPMWILPGPAQAEAWKPSGLEVAPTVLEPKHRTWTTGPLTFELVVTDASHATFTARAGATALMERKLERPVMAGASTAPIDLTQDVPGISQVVAAFGSAPSGPLLVVLATPGYEGTQLTTLSYESGLLREVETMQHYLYACAF